jgi:hypothetical protein
MVLVPRSEVAEQLNFFCPFSFPETVNSIVLVPKSEVTEQLKD